MKWKNSSELCNSNCIHIIFLLTLLLIFDRSKTSKKKVKKKCVLSLMWARLMQFLGSSWQSMSQRNRSHANQPIGGVLIRPLSKARVAPESTDTSRGTTGCIAAEKRHLKGLVQNLSAEYLKVFPIAGRERKKVPASHLPGDSHLSYRCTWWVSPDWVTGCDVWLERGDNLKSDFSHHQVLQCHLISFVIVGILRRYKAPKEHTHDENINPTIKW